VSPANDDHDPHPITHPELTPQEAARQRGDDPANAIGPWPTPPHETRDPDPKFHPDPKQLKLLVGLFDELGKRHRPRREDVLPYEMIRAFVPGDRGARPTWPPTPCWESPDIMLIDAAYTGPFDPSRLVGSPVSGRSYRVFVRVFNLGLLEAVGTQVRAWYVDPGFFNGQPGIEPQPIGGAYVDLEDRTRPGSHRVVEIDLPWVIPAALTGHECLIAMVECVADPWSGSFDANQDRHLGQRNLDIAVGAQNMGPLIGHLGGILPAGGALEVLHGGSAVVPLLRGVVGGRLPHAKDVATAQEVVAPDPRTLRHGLPIPQGHHLLTATRSRVASMAVPTELLADATLAGRARTTDHERGIGAPAHLFAEPGVAVRMLRGLDPEASATKDLVLIGGANDFGRLLPAALRKMLDIGDLRAGSIAAALGGARGAAHLLRFVATDEVGALIGGYSIVVA
jgi:hypothetical protein